MLKHFLVPHRPVVVYLVDMVVHLLHQLLLDMLHQHLLHHLQCHKWVTHLECLLHQVVSSTGIYII